jgi:hypothetical protein
VAQEEKREEDSWQGIIEEWLKEDAPIDRYDTKLGTFGDCPPSRRDHVCTQEIWDDCLKMKRDCKPVDRRRVGGIMKSQKEWKSVSTIRFGIRYGRQRGWRKLGEETPF